MKQTQTIKKSKAVYIIGSITLGIIALLAVYLILLATGVISAEPTPIVISTASRAAEYNGTELTADEWELYSGTLKDGHELRVTVTGAQTEVGVSRNTASAAVYDGNGYDVTDSYKITFKLGELEVTPRTLVLQSASAEKDYDGTPLVSNSCAIAGGSLLFGHEITYYVNGTLTGSGKTDNTFLATISDGTRDVTRNYNIEYLFGTLYVHGEKLEILTHTAKKTYDGTELTCEDWTLTSGVLQDGHRLEVNVFGSQTDVGTSDNIASCKVFDENGVEITDIYEPVFTFGTLTVAPIIIVLETRPAYKIYDGTPLKSDGWRIVTDSTLATDEWKKSGESMTVGEYTVTATVIGEITDVGVEDNTAVFVTITRADGEPCEGVDISYKLGVLTVDPRTITVQSGTAGKEYDGKPLTYDEYEVVSLTKVADGQRILVAVTGTITYVGQTANTIAEVQIWAGDTDVTRNYNIRIQEGVLTVISSDNTSGGDSNDESSEPDDSDGSGDIDESGELSGGDENEDDGEKKDPSVALMICSDGDGSVYLRYMSYGGYTGSGWETAAAYPFTVKATDAYGNTASYGMNYLTGAALSSNLDYNRAEIKLVNTSQYFLPYYLSTDALGYTVQGSDVIFVGNSPEYSMYYYSYNYIADGGRMLDNASLGAFGDAELAYRQYVYENYLAVPDSTREYMNGIIRAHGFDGLSTADKIAAVASYVRSAATYNLEYDSAMDSESDVAVAFLETYKEGVCRHYATAATLILRTLGLPARYCIGYVADVRSGEWVEVTTDKAHAWTEVYIDGAGWVQIEVTGGGAGFDGTGDSGSTGIGNPESDDILSIKPFDVYLNYAEFDGTPFTYDLATLQGLTALEAKGYTYEFTVTGSQSVIGIGESKIVAFKLFDRLGNDVTDEYNIQLSTGKLHIYVQEITVRTESAEGVYDGKALRTAADGWECAGTLLEGHSIYDVTLTGAQFNVGRSLNTFDITVVDADGNDVTYMYKVNSECGTLRVTAREITVTAGSAIGFYNELNGGALVCGDYEIVRTDGEDGAGLGDGDYAVVSISGAQAEIGKSDNVIASVTVYNADGKDVTANYSIKYVSGTLIVLPSSAMAVGESEGVGD